MFSKLLNPKPKSKETWVRIFGSRNGMVETCIETGAYRTIMVNYVTGEAEYIPGNFLVSLAGYLNVLVLCGTDEEYEEIHNILKQRYRTEHVGITRLTDERQTYRFQQSGLTPTIYLYGTWWENELSHTQGVTELLNGWI